MLKSVAMSFAQIVLLSVPVLAQVVELSSEQAFDETAVKSSFTGLADGTAASRVLARWGILFPGGDQGSPVILQKATLLFTNNVVRNSPPVGSSAGKPLIVDFLYPVSKVGFVVGNLEGSPEVSLTAFTRTGTELGLIQNGGLADGDFIGIGTNDPAGITKLLISYGDADQAEEIDDLIVEYRNRPAFVSYLAQVGDGPIPGVGALQTSIVVSNLSNSTASGAIRFFDSSGNPLDVTIDGTSTNLFTLDIPGGSSQSLTTEGTSSPTAVGYAKIISNVPVEGTGIFRIVDQTGAVTSEAGVAAAKGSFQWIGAVQKTTAGVFDSGIAAVNVSGGASVAKVDLLDQTGRVVATNSAIAQLDPGGHDAAFLSQIFPVVANQNFDGTIRVTSTVPLVIVILRTAKGIVLSSLPAGTMED